MQLTSLTYTAAAGWDRPFPAAADGTRTLVLAFGPTAVADDPRRPLAELAAAFPTSVVAGGSSSGSVLGDRLWDDELVVTVARFDRTDLTAAAAACDRPEDSRASGRTVAATLAASADLRAVLVLADGVAVNGSDLVRGLNDELAGRGRAVTVTGGMASDGDRYRRAWTVDAVGPSRGVPRGGRVVAVGLSGAALRVGHGSAGGWDRFGPERVITRSDGRTVYEIDGQPALALYKKYLGDRAAGLPQTSLVFPLAVRPTRDGGGQVMRAILRVDDATQSITFGGDVPQGWCGQLMRANLEHLVDGSAAAAEDAFGYGGATDGPTLAVVVSCLGRRAVLGERTEEELEALTAAAPADTTRVGFYSYGEICPHSAAQAAAAGGTGGVSTELHNQTMTIARFAEAA